MHDTTGPRLRPIVIRGARTHNLKNVDVDARAAPADGRDRRQRLGQVVARLRHDLRRRAAPLRRVAVGLRPPVPRADGAARRRLASRACRRRSPSARRTASATRARRSARPPRSTTICACCSRASAGRCAGTAAATSIRETAEAVAERLARCRRARACCSASRCRSSAAAARAGTAATRARCRAPSRDASDDAPELDLLEPPPPADPVAAAIDVLRRKGFARLLSTARRSTSTSSTRRALGDRSTLEVIVDRIKIDPDDPRPVSPTRSRSPISKAAAPRSRSSCRRRRPRRRRRCATSSASASSAARCGIVYELPQPRLFSFNNPFGACPTCHGFGNVMELDLGLVVPDPDEDAAAGRDRAVEQAALPRRTSPR